MGVHAYWQPSTYIVANHLCIFLCYYVENKLSLFPVIDIYCKFNLIPAFFDRL